MPVNGRFRIWAPSDWRWRTGGMWGFIHTKLEMTAVQVDIPDQHLKTEHWSFSVRSRPHLGSKWVSVCVVPHFMQCLLHQQPHVNVVTAIIRIEVNTKHMGKYSGIWGMEFSKIIYWLVICAEFCWHDYESYPKSYAIKETNKLDLKGLGYRRLLGSSSQSWRYIRITEDAF